MRETAGCHNGARTHLFVNRIGLLPTESVPCSPDKAIAIIQQPPVEVRNAVSPIVCYLERVSGIHLWWAGIDPARQ